MGAGGEWELEHGGHVSTARTFIAPPSVARRPVIFSAAAPEPEAVSEEFEELETVSEEVEAAAGGRGCRCCC